MSWACAGAAGRDADGLWDLEDEERTWVARMAHRGARLLRAALEPAGGNLVHSTGAAARQCVFHFHVHVVPRYRADELHLMWHAALAPDADLAARWDRVLAVANSSQVPA